MKRFLIAFGLIFAAILAMAVAAQALPVSDIAQTFVPMWFRGGIAISPTGTNANPKVYQNASVTNVVATICDAPSDAGSGTWSARSGAFGAAGLSTSEVITINSAVNWTQFGNGNTPNAPRIFTSGAGSAATAPAGTAGNPTAIGDSCSVVLDAASSSSNQAAHIAYTCAITNGTAATLYLTAQQSPITPRTGRRCVQISGS